MTTVFPIAHSLTRKNIPPRQRLREILRSRVKDLIRTYNKAEQRSRGKYTFDKLVEDINSEYKLVKLPPLSRADIRQMVREDSAEEKEQEDLTKTCLEYVPQHPILVRDVDEDAFHHLQFDLIGFPTEESTDEETPTRRKFKQTPKEPVEHPAIAVFLPPVTTPSEEGMLSDPDFPDEDPILIHFVRRFFEFIATRTTLAKGQKIPQIAAIVHPWFRALGYDIPAIQLEDLLRQIAESHSIHWSRDTKTHNSIQSLAHRIKNSPAPENERLLAQIALSFLELFFATQSQRGTAVAFSALGKGQE